MKMSTSGVKKLVKSAKEAKRKPGKIAVRITSTSVYKCAVSAHR